MRWILPVLASVFGGAAAHAAGGGVKDLAFPADACALETLTHGIVAVGRFDDRVVLLPRGRVFAVTAPFRRDAKTKAEMFGKITEQSKQEIAKAMRVPPDVEWRAVDRVLGKGLLLDGSGFYFLETDPATWAEVSRRGVPWDTLKPPRDRGGEGTAGEIARFRAAFASAYQKTMGVKIAGLAPVPTSWRAKGAPGRAYFAATRIAGHPLLELECPSEEPSSCVVSRSCNVEKVGDLRPTDVTGIAVRAAERLILIGDASRKHAVGFKYESCHHVVRTKQEWVFPARLKELTNLSVDADGWLWASSAVPDDYHNASVYCWRPEEW